MGRILRQMCATTVQLGGPLTKALSHVLHVIKVRLQILMDQDANHVPTDSSSRRREYTVPRMSIGVHAAEHWRECLHEPQLGLSKRLHERTVSERYRQPHDMEV